MGRRASPCSSPTLSSLKTHTEQRGPKTWIRIVRKEENCINIVILDIDQQQDVNNKRGAKVMLHVSTAIQVNFEQ